MSVQEIRAIAALAAIFALRMLGLFWIVPVFSIYAQHIPGGDNPFLVGLALGIYGLMQAIFYIPYGKASDRLGRKPVIAAGLLIFALGSAVAAAAPDIKWIIAGRALQGAGAISSALSAFVADLTAEHNRVKAMAMIGASIGVSFAFAIVTAPVLFDWIGMRGLFAAIGVLAIAALGVLRWGVPAQPAMPPSPQISAPFVQALRNTELLRLNFGVFVLHATQIALFIVAPRLLEAAGLAAASHWKIYLPVMGLSFALMAPAIIAAEKTGQIKALMLGAILCSLSGLLLFTQLTFALWGIAMAWFIYFAGFNILEAAQPAMVSKRACTRTRGAAMGIYNTAQALGYFAGGAAGGWLFKSAGTQPVFWACAALALIWLMIAARMK
ncbi:Permease of the major facilitator superfamily [Candidatus Glomeribacter gigasporarum BEG34]|uniref:Permease of the major facilitator superfamily n=1 Tax=Candidatus Glomeribacter gigasporarum BEG34 TaxID=1070319 RepID=G2JBS2_9BURK|nr:MFS transporter [Candidatus Glomeribacter gigasporarum]CCD30227.1 Permease of the major facilitator superfamily [Candidatus Glomeribacter gigasporarum BEG34]